MRKLQMVIIDHNDESRQRMQQYLNEYYCFELIGVFETGEKFMETDLVDRIDVLFTNFKYMDTGRGADGSYVQYYVQKNNPRCLRIFLSDDQGEAYRAFLYGGFDFLKKPVEPDEYRRVLDRIRKYFEDIGFFGDQHSHSFMAKSRQGYEIIRTENTIYIELVDRLCVFYMDDGRKVALSGQSMKKIESSITEFGFFRCHQSLLVNLAKINSVMVNAASKWYSLKMEGCEKEIPLSREKYNELLERLNSQYSRLPH